MIKTNKISAVIVTFNRKNLLIECIDSLLNQTRAIDKIIIIDNASTDGTNTLLREGGYLKNDNISYKLMEENLGGAGGFHEGIKVAHDLNVDWIWVMDDDAEPALDSIERLENYFNIPEIVGVCPVVINSMKMIEDHSLHRGWMKTYDRGQIVRGIGAEDMMGYGAIEIDHCSFVGLCFKANIIEKIGLPKKEFFIHYDDLEYSARIRKMGKILLVKDSQIMHKEAANVNNTKEVKIFGRASTRVIYEKLWLQYYGYRNLIWLFNNGIIEINYIIKIKILIDHLRKLIGVIIYDDKKIQRLKFWNNAYYDGKNNIFNNLNAKKILYKN